MFERTKKYLDVIEFPATKDAGVASIESEEFFDFEESGTGTFDVVLSCLNASKITDNLTVQPYVSFDKGDSWYKSGAAYTDLISSGGTAAVQEVVSIVLTAGDTKAKYEAKYFILYDGDTPFLVWFDHSGVATKPEVTGFTTCDDVKLDISAADDNTDSIGGTLDAHAGLAAAGFTAGYTAGSDTLAITVDAAGACTNASSGNLLSGTPCATTFAITAQGKDAIPGLSAYKATFGIAPRVKVVANFDATGALASGHGCKVDVILKEADVRSRKVVYEDCLTVPTVVPAGFIYTSNALYATEAYYPISKVYMAIYCADLSKVTDQVRYILESSNDGINWWAASAAGTDIANGTGVLHTVVTVTNGSTYYLGKYVRTKIYSNNATGALASGHGIKANLVLVY